VLVLVVVLVLGKLSNPIQSLDGGQTAKSTAIHRTWRCHANRSLPQGQATDEAGGTKRTHQTPSHWFHYHQVFVIFAPFCADLLSQVGRKIFSHKVAKIAKEDPINLTPLQGDSLLTSTQG
jgi:hypothetical protein